jgi:hypothetical protein
LAADEIGFVTYYINVMPERAILTFSKWGMFPDGNSVKLENELLNSDCIEDSDDQVEMVKSNKSNSVRVRLVLISTDKKVQKALK